MYISSSFPWWVSNGKIVGAAAYLPFYHPVTSLTSSFFARESEDEPECYWIVASCIFLFVHLNGDKIDSSAGGILKKDWFCLLLSDGKTDLWLLLCLINFLFFSSAYTLFPYFLSFSPMAPLLLFWFFNTFLSQINFRVLTFWVCYFLDSPSPMSHIHSNVSLIL